MLGPTGAGKSATLNALCLTTMAVHRPRLVIVDAGDSFDLLGQYFERLGLVVHRQRIVPGAGVSLPVFANAMRLLDEDGIDRGALAQPMPPDELNEEPEGAALVETIELPHAKTKGWEFTDISRLDLDSYGSSPAEVTISAPPPSVTRQHSSR